MGIEATAPAILLVTAPSAAPAGGGEAGIMAELLRNAVSRALAGPPTLSADLAALDGMSGLRYRQLINDLIATLAKPRYLEIGCFKGSTLCSAIAGNAVHALAIDNWSEFGGPVGEFYTNLSRFKGSSARVSIIESDFRAVDYGKVGSFNVFMFDGPHTEIDHYDAIVLAQPALDRNFILIVDDWNLADVRRGTRRGLTELGLGVEAWVEIRTTLDDTHPNVSWQNSDWHDGYLLAVLRKPC